MKKRISLLLGVLLLIGATGCEKEPQKQDMTGAYNVYEGYLTVKDNQLIVDEIKFIDLADKYWIDSLNLTEEDMTNGYYIYNPSDEKLTFTLNEQDTIVMIQVLYLFRKIMKPVCIQHKRYLSF